MKIPTQVKGCRQTTYWKIEPCYLEKGRFEHPANSKLIALGEIYVFDCEVISLFKTVHKFLFLCKFFWMFYIFFENWHIKFSLILLEFLENWNSSQSTRLSSGKFKWEKLLQKNLRKAGNFSLRLKIENFLVEADKNRERLKKKFAGNGVRARIFAVWPSFSANNQYTKGVRLNIDRLKWEVAWVRKVTHKWRTTWEKK